MRTEIKDASVMMQDLFDDKNVKVYMPSENAKLEINISGMNTEDLAKELYNLSLVLMEAVKGNAEVRTNTRYFPDTGVEYHSKWTWEEEYDECDYVTSHIITGCKNEGDGWMVELSPEFVKVAKSGVLLTDWLKKGVEDFKSWAEGESK